MKAAEAANFTGTNNAKPRGKITERMLRTRMLIRRAAARRERYPSAQSVALGTLLFFASALSISFFDSRFLLYAWMMFGPLVIAIYMSIDGKTSLFNPYTLFFGANVVGGLIGFSITGPML